MSWFKALSSVSPPKPSVISSVPPKQVVPATLPAKLPDPVVAPTVKPDTTTVKPALLMGGTTVAVAGAGLLPSLLGGAGGIAGTLGGLGATAMVADTVSDIGQKLVENPVSLLVVAGVVVGGLVLSRRL